MRTLHLHPVGCAGDDPFAVGVGGVKVHGLAVAGESVRQSQAHVDVEEFVDTVDRELGCYRCRRDAEGGFGVPPVHGCFVCHASPPETHGLVLRVPRPRFGVRRAPRHEIGECTERICMPLRHRAGRCGDGGRVDARSRGDTAAHECPDRGAVRDECLEGPVAAAGDPSGPHVWRAVSICRDFVQSRAFCGPELCVRCGVHGV